DAAAGPRLRAPPLPRLAGDGRSDRGHGRLRREAGSELHGFLSLPGRRAASAAGQTRPRARGLLIAGLDSAPSPGAESRPAAHTHTLLSMALRLPVSCDCSSVRQSVTV